MSNDLAEVDETKDAMKIFLGVFLIEIQSRWQFNSGIH